MLGVAAKAPCFRVHHEVQVFEGDLAEEVGDIFVNVHDGKFAAAPIISIFTGESTPRSRLPLVVRGGSCGISVGFCSGVRKMRDAEFFKKALGLQEPWRVKSVTMDMVARRVEVEIECVEGTVWGEGGERLHIQGYEARQWRHLETTQFETILKARVPRVKYPDGHTEMVRVPWAQPHGRFTFLFESWAVEVLPACQSVRTACELLDLDWGGAQRIMDRAVERGLVRRSLEGIQRVGMDEKSFGRGHDYIGILNDLDGSRVLEVTPGNDTGSGRRLWQALGREQRGKVKAAAMDMSAGFAAATRLEAPQAVIVYDKFHVSSLLNKAEDLVRRQEHRALSKEGMTRSREPGSSGSSTRSI